MRVCWIRWCSAGVLDTVGQCGCVGYGGAVRVCWIRWGSAGVLDTVGQCGCVGYGGAVRVCWIRWGSAGVLDTVGQCGCVEYYDKMRLCWVPGPDFRGMLRDLNPPPLEPQSDFFPVHYKNFLPNFDAPCGWWRFSSVGIWYWMHRSLITLQHAPQPPGLYPNLPCCHVISG